MAHSETEDIFKLKPVAYKEIGGGPPLTPAERTKAFWEFFKPPEAHVVVSGEMWGEVACWCGEYHGSK